MLKTGTEPKVEVGDQRVSRSFFPGWTMLVISAMAMFMSGPGQSYSVAAIKDPMRESLNVSETRYSIAYGVATLVSGLLLPLIGRLLDSWGARILLPIIGAALGCACFLMSMTDSLLDLFIGFAFIRSLGQGALSLISVWIVSEWFEKKRGFATALAGIGGSLSVMTFPILNRLLIEKTGWENVWRVHAIMIVVGIVVPAIVFLRNRPEDLGMLPDGESADPLPPERNDGADTVTNIAEVAKLDSASEERSESDLETDSTPRIAIPPTLAESWSLGEVLRDSTFWKLLAVPSASGMIGTGLVFHQASLLGSRGVSRDFAIDLIAGQAVIATIAALFVGWLTDRFQIRYILAAAMALLSFATLWVQLLPLPVLAAVYAVAMGLHGSVLRSAGMVVWVNYYGRAQQGRIRGVSMSVMILAAALGPLPLAISIDWFGTYDPAMWLFVAIPIFSGICVWTAKQPVHPRHRLPLPNPAAEDAQ